ncbi:MAG: hypothetical protein XU08_C0001G0197 [candidate division WWE3 bacterium CSP1-7]|uniref:Uncharacterized protein n=1 Tax=candidate division WWE3 bacterium CSP1-7 TaxID=1576480 RepID=A0A0T5ZYC5_UNCKA|nr:MAG: hypothetical protein XU08_C0001G0197 [candidate division WWE3 bacterium CSP1-7]
MFKFVRESGLVQLILLIAIGVILYYNWPKIWEGVIVILNNLQTRFKL